MIAYDTQLYTFLTQPENFEPFIELKEQYDKVRERLINEFWDLVLEKANNLKPQVMPWKFSLEGPNSSYRKLYASHPEISDEDLNAGVLYEYLHSEVLLGAWFDRGKFADPAMISIWEDAKTFAKQDPTIKDDYTWKVGNGGWWYAFLKKPGLNLSQKASLLQILPHVREPLAEFYASQLISTVEQFASFVLKHAKKA